MRTYNMFLSEDLNENGKLMTQYLFSENEDEKFKYEVDFDYPSPFSALDCIQLIKLGMRLVERGYNSISVTKL